MKAELDWLEVEHVPLDGAVSLQIFRHTPANSVSDSLGAQSGKVTSRREGVHS